MGRIRRTFAWILILGGGFILLSLALNFVIERPEGGKPLELKALLAAGVMLGVCPIFLGSMLRREAPPRAKPSEPFTTPPTATPTGAPVPLAVATTTTDPHAIVCTVTLTQQDVVRFHYWNYRRRIGRLFVVFGIMIAVMLAIQLQQRGSIRLTVTVPVLILVVGTLSVSPYWVARNQFRRVPALRKTAHFEFSSSALRMRTDDSDSTCGWTTVPEVHESQHALLLMVQPNLFRILPKSSFAQEDLPRFRQLMSEQLGDRWHPLTASPAQSI